jgi:hypothetical protein
MKSLNNSDLEEYGQVFSTGSYEIWSKRGGLRNLLVYKKRTYRDVPSVRQLVTEWDDPGLSKDISVNVPGLLLRELIKKGKNSMNSSPEIARPSAPDESNDWLGRLELLRRPVDTSSSPPNYVHTSEEITAERRALRDRTDQATQETPRPVSSNIPRLSTFDPEF